MSIYVLKLSTEKDSKFMGITKGCEHEYTLCKESESMYDGRYPTATHIVCYSKEGGGEIVVPYIHGVADSSYGFYEGESLKRLVKVIKNSFHCEQFSELYPEYFI